MNMNVGNLKQKASSRLVLFVLSCSVIITGLLYIKEKSESTAQALSAVNENYISE